MLETLQATGGIYFGFFAFAVISGLFPVANIEFAFGYVVYAIDDLPRAFAIAVLIAIGQTIGHSVVYFSARGVTTLSAKRREKLQAKLARARAVVERWRDRWLLLLCCRNRVLSAQILLIGGTPGAAGYTFRRVQCQTPARPLMLPEQALYWAGTD